MIAFFISDLHLHPDKPAITKAFQSSLRWMQKQAQGISDKRLYILGDLVDAWVGDDNPLPLWGQLREILRAQKLAGFQVFFLAGNRDFLMGEGFLKAAGVTLLSEPHVVQLDSIPCVLMHGDLLCQYDIAYQRFRYWIRQAWMRRAYLALPLCLRLGLAKFIRSRSAQQQSLQKRQNQRAFFRKTQIEPAWVQVCLQQNNASVLIHGHVHQEGEHHLPQSGLFRYVLGDWDNRPSVLQYCQGAFRFHHPNTSAVLD